MMAKQRVHFGRKISNYSSKYTFNPRLIFRLYSSQNFSLGEAMSRARPNPPNFTWLHYHSIRGESFADVEASLRDDVFLGRPPRERSFSFTRLGKAGLRFIRQLGGLN